MKVCVTGALGYKGSVLVPRLLAEGIDVLAVDVGWFSYRLPQHSGLSCVLKSYDTLTPSELEGCDTIIHLASVANDPSGDLDPRLTWETNVLGINSLCRSAIEARVRQIIFASSGSVYGISEEPEVTEDTPLVPISDYNKTKMIGERVFESYSDYLNLQIIRPATVCGLSPRQRLDVVVNMFCYQGHSENKLRVLGGEQSRPHIHMQDLVSLYMFLVSKPDVCGVFNAGFENLSVLEVAKLVASKTGASIEIFESNDPRSYNLDSSKIVRLGFQPQYKVVDAIDELIDFFSKTRFEAATDNYNVKTLLELIAQKGQNYNHAT